MPRMDAQQVVIELLRSASGAWEGRNRLFQAFYLAHLYFASKEPGILTDWPIVRLPQGPSIGNSSTLIQGLVRNGLLKVERIQEGPYPEQRYNLTDKGRAEPPVPADAQAAIQTAAEFVRLRSSSELSQLTQQRSRSWREARDGEVLDIYVDLIPEDEIEAEQEKTAALDRQLTTALLDRQLAGNLGVKAS